jgi:uncharacterized protein (TIGR00266 family)
MDIQVEYRPSFSLVIARLGPSEQIVVESGAMVAMRNVTMETKARGGVLKSLARAALGGESFFVNTFTAGGSGGEIMLAHALPGDIKTMELHGETMLVQSGSFIASSAEIEVDTKWGGAKSFFAGEGLILLRTSGSGQLILGSYGAVHELDLAAGEQITVDSGHLVAFSESVVYKPRAVGGIKATLFSGEGIVVDITGPGKLLMQTRSETAFIGWIIPKLPFERKS